jgi:uncharacterized protein YyaL (SSP411 family)
MTIETTETLEKYRQAGRVLSEVRATAAGRVQKGAKLFDVAAGSYRPFSLVLTLGPGAPERLATVAPFLSGMHRVDGQAAAYVCRDFACRAPVTTPEALARELFQSRPA